MTYEEATGQTTDTMVDQDGADYIRDDGGFAISCAGHYTLAELEYKVEQLKDANRFYAQRAEAAAAAQRAADLDAAEAAERAERVAAGIAQFEGELAAAGVEFALGTADTYGTVYRAGSVLGTVTRPTRGERRWTFHTPDGALAFTTPGRLTMLSRLAKRFAR